MHLQCSGKGHAAGPAATADRSLRLAALCCKAEVKAERIISAQSCLQTCNDQATF